LKTAKLFTFTLIGFLLLACNLGGIVQIKETVPTPAPASETPTVIEPSLTVSPTQGFSADQTPVVLDPCSLITFAEAEAILAEPAGPPQTISGLCAYNNARDSLYTVSVAAAQDHDTIGLLQGQTMLVGFTGGKLDEARMEKIKTMSATFDYKGVFYELTAAAENLPTLKARLVDDDDFDLVFWAWITAQTRRQGAYVAVRGQTMVNINLIVADTQSDGSMLAASKSLAEKIFERLPAKFTLPKPTPTPTLPAATSTPTLVGGVIVPQSFPTDVPTIVPPSGPSPVPTWVGPTPIPPSGPSPVPQSGPTLIPSPTFVN
jgi:hypothetical protein